MQCYFFFFLNDTAPPEIYPLPLPDALPIPGARRRQVHAALEHVAQLAHVARPIVRHERLHGRLVDLARRRAVLDRKSTRLNSSHSQISYAVFCLKKKKTQPYTHVAKYSIKH